MYYVPISIVWQMKYVWTKVKGQTKGHALETTVCEYEHHLSWNKNTVNVKKKMTKTTTSMPGETRKQQNLKQKDNKKKTKKNSLMWTNEL